MYSWAALQQQDTFARVIADSMVCFWNIKPRYFKGNSYYYFSELTVCPLGNHRNPLLK